MFFLRQLICLKIFGNDITYLISHICAKFERLDEILSDDLQRSFLIFVSNLKFNRFLLEFRTKNTSFVSIKKKACQSFSIKHLPGRSISFFSESYLTARPRSAIQHVPSFFTRIFFDLMSRCAIEGFVFVPLISLCRCSSPLTASKRFKF